MTAPRPRFVGTTARRGELHRYVVRRGDHTIGQVASQPVGQAGALWIAYTLTGQPITYDDPRQDDGGPQGKVRKFLSRREAANALLLAAAPPDRLPTEAASRARHPSGGGPR